MTTLALIFLIAGLLGCLWRIAIAALALTFAAMLPAFLGIGALVMIMAVLLLD